MIESFYPKVRVIDHAFCPVKKIFSWRNCFINPSASHWLSMFCDHIHHPLQKIKFQKTKPLEKRLRENPKFNQRLRAMNDTEVNLLLDMQVEVEEVIDATGLPT
ncbi:MAG: hypothetical protein SH856_12295 [Flavobacteriales bacterium]|nr:hypothetical protein [Flavobacteriales bacterium]